MIKIQPQGLELRMSSDDRSEPVLTQAICCVSFSNGMSYSAFVGLVLDVRSHKTGERDVVVAIPPQILTTNQRHSFRVPVIKDSGLETVISTPDKRRFDVTTRDIAETGIEFEFGTDECPSLVAGTSLDVELRLRGEIVQRRGEVRRAIGNVCGLSFNALSDEDGCRRVARMNGFVLTLQQMWLKSRMK